MTILLVKGIGIAYIHILTQTARTFRIQYRNANRKSY